MAKTSKEIIMLLKKPKFGTKAFLTGPDPATILLVPTVCLTELYCYTSTSVCAGSHDGAGDNLGGSGIFALEA